MKAREKSIKHVSSVVSSVKAARSHASGGVMILGDMHLRDDSPISRTDDYQSEQFRKLDWICDLVAEIKPSVVIVPGDIFHRWKVSPALEAEAITFFRLLGNTAKVLAIPGNHDLPQHSMNLLDKCSFAVLRASGCIWTLVHDPYAFRLPKIAENAKKNVTVYGLPYGTLLSDDVIPDADPDDYTIVVAHQLVWLQSHPPFPGATGGGSSHITKICTKPDLIITGDNHASFRFTDVRDGRKRHLVNVGSMMRMTADQVDHKPVVAYWDPYTNAVTIHEIPISQGVITFDHLEASKAKDDRMDAFIAKMEDGEELDFDFRDAIRNTLQKKRFAKRTVNKVWEIIDKEATA